MTPSDLPELTHTTEPDGTVVVAGENDLMRISLRVHPSIWSDPRARHLLDKLFVVNPDQEQDEERAA